MNRYIQLKTFFISNPSNDLFALYGAQSRKQSIEDILAHCQKQVLVLLKFAMQSASIDFMLTESSPNNTLTNYNVQLKLPLLVKSMIGNKIKELIHQNATAFFQLLNDQKSD